MNDEPEVQNLPVPHRSSLPDVVNASASTLSTRERDYVMIALFVRIQHLRFDEAQTLIDALMAAGETTADILFAKAVVENALQDHEAALNTVRQLEKLDPAIITAGSKSTRRARMRAYIKARCCFALNDALDEEGRAALDFYLRHGRPTTKGKKSKR